MKRIVNIQDEIQNLKNEADVLNKALVERQERIIFKIKNIFNEEIIN
jgi:hypothetical protein